MTTPTSALLEDLTEWVQNLDAQDAEQVQTFIQAYPKLHAQVMDFGCLLDNLEERGAEVPDSLFQVAAYFLQVLDIVWDQAHGNADETVSEQGLEYLGYIRMTLLNECAILENTFETLASSQSGVEL